MKQLKYVYVEIFLLRLMILLCISSLVLFFFLVLALREELCARLTSQGGRVVVRKSAFPLGKLEFQVCRVQVLSRQSEMTSRTQDNLEGLDCYQVKCTQIAD